MQPSSVDVAIIGAGPNGLGLATVLRKRGVNHRIFGSPMQTWRDMPRNMNLKSLGFATSIPTPNGDRTFPEYCRANGLEDYEPIEFATFAQYGVDLQRDLVPYLNESALFRGQWQLRPVGGKEGWRQTLETEARPRLRALLDEAIAGQILRPAVVYGYFPCNGDGNDVVVWDGDGNERVRFSFPRQRRDRRLCIADFFRPIESGEPDVIGMHVVTMGLAASEATARLFADNRYREYLELHGVTVEMAEALAEYWHQRVRQELGIAGEDAADMEDLFDQGYRGSRYSFGYPACPDLEEQTKLFELLRPERIGVELSEEFQLHPEQSTSAIIVHHPEAKYFNAR